MAARRDEWLTDASTKDPAKLPALLRELREVSLTKLEARLLALCFWPRTEALARAAVQYFEDGPVRFREQLGTSVAAVGLAWVHHATPTALTKVKPPARAASEQVARWHEVVVEALRAALAHRQTPPKPDAERGPGELPAGPRAALQAAWLAKAARRCPDDLPQLLARLDDGPATDLAERALALLAFARDGRIADAAAQLLARPPVKVSVETPLFTVLALVLCVHGGRDHAGPARALAERLPSFVWLEGVLPDTKREAAPKPRRDAPRSDDDFLAAIAHAPGDDARVALYLDWLLEQGAPLGEFMALQRAGRALTPKEERRLAALQRRHEKTWLGSLARGGKGSARFRGGLVRELSLRCWTGADVPRLDEPRLATIERLELVGSTNLPLAELLRAPGWKSLRALTVPRGLLSALPAPLLERLEELGFSSAPSPEPLPEVRRLRRLRLTEQWRAEWEVIEQWPSAQHLEGLWVETSSPLPWVRFVARVAEVELLPAWPEATSTAGFGLHFRDGKLVRVSTLRAPLPSTLIAMLEQLEARVRRGAKLELDEARCSAEERARLAKLTS